MEIGYRVFNKGDISRFDLDFVQVSIWHKNSQDMGRISGVCDELRKNGISYVIHILGLYLSDTRPEREEALCVLMEYSKMSDLGLILHDEILPNGDRLTGPWKANYEDGLKALREICNVSLENSHDSHNAAWFWDEFADSITLDIGHFVSAGIDVLQVIKGLNNDHISRLDFVHVHKHNGWRPGGITDHWALEEGCLELQALKELLERKNDVKVIVEVDGDEELRKSVDLVSELKNGGA
ncbi:MAG: hypothetical protein V3V92_01615 [Candidatus Hydrothermarchaeales archaeon]